MIRVEPGGAPIILRFLWEIFGRFRPIASFRCRIWQTAPAPITLGTGPGNLPNENRGANKVGSCVLRAWLPTMPSVLGAATDRAA
jgi:hypothetical protein